MRRLYLRELWRTQGGWLISAVLVLVVAAWASLDAQYYWFAGFMAGVSLTYLGLVYTSLRAEERLRVEKDVTVTIADSGLHLTFASVTSDIPWEAIAFVRRTKDGLVLTPRYGARPFLLPSDALSEEAQLFTLRAVTTAGGRTSDGA